MQLSWSLRIRGVTPQDAGRYECQATTHPPQSIVVRLKIVGKTYIPTILIILHNRLFMKPMFRCLNL